MKSQSIDISCKTRENALELYLKLERIDYVYNLSLFETINVQTLIRWISLPMPNGRIKNYIQTNFRKIIAVAEKRHKDGHISSIGIVTISKRELEQNPSPSYITVVRCKLYATYSGQNVTCRYCSEVGNVQTTIID